MYAFNYHKASSVADAAARLSAGVDAKLLAGGQTLIAALKMRLAAPSDLIDLGGIAEMRGVRTEGGKLVIGAMTTHAQVAASQDVRQSMPALAVLAASIGDRMVRNMGTLGGSVANADPAADYPAAVIGLGATIITNKRGIGADDFFKGMYETALQPGEIITQVAFPIPQKCGYAKFANPASRYAIVGVLVAQTGGGVRVGVTGAGPCAFRVPEMEKALVANFAPDAVASVKISHTSLNSDLHASAEYRAHLVAVMAKRAVAAALGQ
ncbi:MAG: xanthine dehydrogenase family protein subunit M [Burkholderiales bacterium]|nr:xanthine dehydrogenase family protein subunit M [Burkholderiales bacterium]